MRYSVLFEIFTIVLFTVLALGPTCFAGEPIIEDFSDGDVTDGNPFEWQLDDPQGSGELVDGAFRLGGAFATCCSSIYTIVDQYTDISIETKVRYLSDDSSFVGVTFRDTIDGIPAGYWAGVQSDGEIGMGFNENIDITARGEFLEPDIIQSDAEITFRVDVLKNEILLSAWETGNADDTITSISWTDRRDLFPTGDAFSVFLNPRGNAANSIDVLSISVETTNRVEGDYDRDGSLTANDADLLAEAIRRPNPDHALFDENGDGLVDQADRLVWVHEHANTFLGDSNLDGEFNSTDFVQVFQAGKYEEAMEAGWSEGDWNGNGQFNSSDLVAAFQDGGYELGPRINAVAVPEPTECLSILLVNLGAVMFLSRKRL